jgi:hypothetical protein
MELLVGSRARSFFQFSDLTDPDMGPTTHLTSPKEASVMSSNKASAAASKTAPPA